MKNNILLTALLAVISFSGYAQTSKIHHGVPAEKGEFPFYTALNLADNKAGHRCGGVLINKQWVMTAAHCVEGGGKYNVLYDLVQYEPVSIYKEKIAVAKTIIHPKRDTDPSHKKNNPLYDIALLKLKKPVKSEVVAKINGLDETINLPVNTPLTVTGFGLTETGQRPDILMKTSETILTDAACTDVPPGYPPTHYNPEFNICAGNKKGGVAGGDSGGPLMVKNQQSEYVVVGLVSRSLMPPAEQFIRVSAFADWIRETIASH
ncbi:S1 family peptidase [Enterobacteriaceae bacterium LUAb1]